jgi:hypothetical protein
LHSEKALHVAATMQLQFVAATMQQQRPLATPLLLLLSSIIAATCKACSAPP